MVDSQNKLLRRNFKTASTWVLYSICRLFRDWFFKRVMCYWERNSTWLCQSRAARFPLVKKVMNEHSLLYTYVGYKCMIMTTDVLKVKIQLTFDLFFNSYIHTEMLKWRLSLDILSLWTIAISLYLKVEEI